VSECPRCASRLDEAQEYCLECGFRLPGDGRFGGPPDPGKGWLLRSAVALLAASAGAALAVAATGTGSGSAEVVTATGGFATAPTTSTLPSPETGRRGIVEWPAGEPGWTIVLASVPQAAGRRVAETRSRQARRKGVTPVGILDSSRFASLHPGYWVVFTGVFPSEAEAASALQAARRASRTAAVRRIVP
jgi:hypothetical protein